VEGEEPGEVQRLHEGISEEAEMRLFCAEKDDMCYTFEADNEGDALAIARENGWTVLGELIETVSCSSHTEQLYRERAEATLH